jgi:hypothetical protein
LPNPREKLGGNEVPKSVTTSELLVLYSWRMADEDHDDRGDELSGDEIVEDHGKPDLGDIASPEEQQGIGFSRVVVSGRTVDEAAAVVLQNLAVEQLFETIDHAVRMRITRVHSARGRCR